MKKILFSDRFGLTDAVLSWQKTMTRRVEKKFNHPLVTDISEWGIDDKGKCYLVITYSTGLTEDVYPPYQIGEEIAIAQPYKDICLTDPIFFEGMRREAGWNNKMFVAAEYMPHRINITDIKLERLTDITEEDCRKEGIICVNFRQWLKQDLDDFSPQEYVDHDLWTLPIFRSGIENGWEEQSKDDIASYTAKTAFIVLFAKLSRKSPSEVNALNPWLFAYEFKLIKD